MADYRNDNLSGLLFFKANLVYGVHVDVDD